ncbi:MAG: papain-like cysteine protease family protein [Sedimentisphaerales bacterium]
MSIMLDVPLVGQRRGMSCWYASACMVAYYRAPGPRLGLPTEWNADTGLFPADFVRLAANEGLRPIRLPTPHWTPGNTEANLAIHGPLWCAGYWYGFPHVIVLTGVNGNTVYVNDPDGPRRREGTLDWFNARLASNIANCVMYQPRR